MRSFSTGIDIRKKTWGIVAMYRKMQRYKKYLIMRLLK